jgi:hypothetical protein
MPNEPKTELALTALQVRALCIVTAIIFGVVGVLLLAAVLAAVPNIALAVVLLALAASWCRTRIECMLFNHGSKPLRYRGVTASVDTSLEAYPAGASVDALIHVDEHTEDVAEPAELNATEPVAEPGEVDADADSVTVESLTEELVEAHLQLEAEREVIAALIGDLNPEVIIGESD